MSSKTQFRNDEQKTEITATHRGNGGISVYEEDPNRFGSGDKIAEVERVEDMSNSYDAEFDDHGVVVTVVKEVEDNGHTVNVDKPVSYVEPKDGIESFLTRIVDEIVSNTDIGYDMDMDAVRSEVLKTYDTTVLEEVTPR